MGASARYEACYELVQVRFLRPPQFNMYRIEHFLNPKYGDYRGFKLSEKRSNEIYEHIKARAFARTEDYENWIDAINYLTGGFVFQSVNEILYATALFDNNREKMLRTRGLPSEITKSMHEGKLYHYESQKIAGKTINSVQILNSGFGDWMKDVVEHVRKHHKNDANELFGGDEDDNDE